MKMQSDRFRLKPADNGEFCTAIQIYHDAGSRVAPVYDWEIELHQKASMMRHFPPFWIYDGKQRIGGVLFRKNTIWYPFVIPPFEMSEEIVDILSRKVALLSGDKPYVFVYTLPHTARHFKHYSFRIGERRVAMIRPTESMKAVFDKCFAIRTPAYKDINGIIDLAHRSFHKGASDRYVKKFSGSWRSPEHYRSTIEYFFHKSRIAEKASSVAYSRSAGSLAGFCLVEVINNGPFLLDIAIDSAHQGKGLASGMIRKAISFFNGVYPFITLQVTKTNPAYQLYRKLGFQPLTESWQLYRPVKVTGKV